MPTMFSGDQLSWMIRDIFLFHQNHAKNPEKAFRKFDGKTPYGVHPTLAAMLILHEEHLSEEVRVRGAKALLAHDLLEDTMVPLVALTNWGGDPDVTGLIQELTFTKDENPSVEIWNRSHEAQLLKFYDVTVNLMCVGKMSPDRIQYRREQAKKHLAWVESNYPGLEITKIAGGLLRV